MNEIDKVNLTNQTKFRLNEISRTEHYFNSEINQRKFCSKKLGKYVTAFDYIDKISIVLSATTASAGFTIVFSLATGIIKKLLSTTKKKKHDKILMLAKIISSVD